MNTDKILSQKFNGKVFDYSDICKDHIKLYFKDGSYIRVGLDVRTTGLLNKKVYLDIKVYS